MVDHPVVRRLRRPSRKSLAGGLTGPTVADAIRKELRRSTGQNVDAAEITRLLKETVVRPECLIT